MSTVIVVGGPAGTGKTTISELLAKHFKDCPFVEGDSLHPEANIKKMSAGIPLTDEDRWGWLEKLSVTSAKKADESSQRICIVSCSMLKKVYREYITKCGRGVVSNLQLKFVFLHTTYEELMQRVGHRQGHYMKLDMVKSQFDIMEIPQGDELVVNGGGAVDIDTTGKSPEEILEIVVADLGVEMCN